MQTATVTIGRNYGKNHPLAGTEMPLLDWHLFQDDVKLALDFTLGQPESWLEIHQGYTSWASQPEESAKVTIYDIGLYPQVNLLREELARLCVAYGQDAIAFQNGLSELIEV